MLKGPKNKITIETAVINFNDSYIKLNQHKSCLDSLVNLINSTCDFFDLSDATEDFSNNFIELIDFFNKSKAICGNNEKLIEIRDHIFSNAIESPLFNQLNFSKTFLNSIENIYNNI